MTEKLDMRQERVGCGGESSHFLKQIFLQDKISFSVCSLVPTVLRSGTGLQQRCALLDVLGNISDATSIQRKNHPPNIWIVTQILSNHF